MNDYSLSYIINVIIIKIKKKNYDNFVRQEQMLYFQVEQILPLQCNKSYSMINIRM